MRYVIFIILLSIYSNIGLGQRLFSINGSSGAYQVVDMVEYDGQLIIGGNFNEVLEVTRSNIAAWDGNQVHEMLPGFEQGTDRVRDMVVFNGDLVVAGKENVLGQIGIWDGNAWSDMAGGFNDDVWTLVEFNGELYAGGEFTSSAGDSLMHIARWTGLDWVNVGDGFNGGVRDLEVYNGELYAIGSFTSDGTSSTDLFYLAKWNGSNWVDVQGGLESYGLELLSIPQGLLISGFFDSDYYSNIQLPGLALLNGTLQPFVHQGDTLLRPKSMFKGPNGTSYLGYDNRTISLGLGLFEDINAGPIRNILFFQNDTIVGGDYGYPSFHGFTGIGKLIPGMDCSYLAINNINAKIRPDEMIFHNWPIGNSGFEVPANSGIFSLFGTTTRMVGKFNGVVHGDPHHYFNGRESFGPSATQQTEEFNRKYYQVWHLSAQTIEDHIAQWNDPNYTTPYTIASWPGNGNTNNGEAALLAPFADLDSDDFYEPEDGEYPLIRGDEAVYFIYHNYLDSGHYLLDHLLEAEIHVMLYGFHMPWHQPVHNTIFANFKAINRSGIGYDSTRLAIYSDIDIGNAQDDYIGCDPALNLYYGYNGDEFDEPGPISGYGDHPPAQGVLFLNEPMDNHVYIQNNGVNWPNKFWNDMNGLDMNGDPFQDTCSGYTHYMYPGDPVLGSCWTEGQDGNFPDDRRNSASIPPQYFGPGDTICLDIAYVFGQDTLGDHLSSITVVKQYVQEVQDWYDQNSRGCSTSYGWVTAVEENQEIGSIKLYPNPTGGLLTIEGQFNGKAELEIYSMSGRLVEKQILNGHSEKSTVDFSDLNNSIYLVVLRTEDQPYTERLIKLSY